MPTLRNLATRKDVLDPLTLTSSLVVRKIIKLITATMLITALKPITAIVVTVVTVLVVTVVINIFT